MITRFKILLCISILLPGGRVQAQLAAEGIRPETAGSSEASISQRLYSLNGNNLFWLCDSCASKREALFNLLHHAADYGLSQTYHVDQATQKTFLAGAGERYKADRRISDRAISFCKDLYGGKDMNRWISYDGISPRNKGAVDFLIEGLAAIKDSAGLLSFIASLEPQTAAYRTLKEALALNTSDKRSTQQLSTSLNYYRWIHHFRLDSFIVINIPSATLSYYKGDTAVMEMRAVVGTALHHTPRFAAYCKEVTLYPYWNMPRSILVNEWLGNFRKNPGLIDFLSMELIDARGRVVPASAVNWKSVSKGNFPYRLREKPGCFNPLGVLKFSLTSPYDVYLHDTNFKGAFLAQNRFYSHGCIQVEEPVALADAILVNKVDEGFLKACFKDQKPQIIPIEHPVPVFVVYMCAEAGDDGIVRYYNDVYGLLK